MRSAGRIFVFGTGGRTAGGRGEGEQRGVRQEVTDGRG